MSTAVRLLQYYLWLENAVPVMVQRITNDSGIFCVMKQFPYT